MKNSMTNMKTELKYTIFLGHRKSELAQVPIHAGFRVTSFNPYFSSSNSPSLDLVLFETQTLPNTCPGVIIGCSSYICFFPYNFIIINGIHEENRGCVSASGRSASLHLSLQLLRSQPHPLSKFPVIGTFHNCLPIFSCFSTRCQRSIHIPLNSQGSRVSISSTFPH